MKDKDSLGARLRQLRTAQGLSLRDVEASTKISNGYLHLLESGHVKQPRPAILHKLAAAYKVDYESIMTWAGYLAADRSPKSYGVALSSTLNRTINDLSEEDKAKVAEFIRFIKSQKGH